MMIPDRDNADIICDIVIAAMKNLDSPRVKDIRDNFGFSDEAFREEFGTVAVRLSRQSGHTAAALRLLFANDDALLYVHNGSAKRAIREKVEKLTRIRSGDPQIMQRVLIAGDTNPGVRIPYVKNRSMVIIDTATYIDKAIKDSIIEGNDAKLIVELQ